MRLSLIPAALVAGATLASASPIRVVEVISIAQVNGPVPTPTLFRFGHAAHQANNDLVAEMMKTSGGAEVVRVGGSRGGQGGRGGRGRKPCNGMGRSRSSAFRAKALEWSNALRQALGLPVIVEARPNPGGPPPAHPHFVNHIPPINHVHDNDNGGKKKIGEEQEFHILPFMPDSLPSDINNLPHPRPHRIHHHGHGHSDSYITRFSKAPFVDRLLIAIGMLGKWEGRAVAFVFGAGLGVLLRMFYVLTVVAFRTMKRSNRPTEDGQEQHYVIFVEELEQEAEPTPAPPQYIKDEKIPVQAEN